MTAREARAVAQLVTAALKTSGRVEELLAHAPAQANDLPRDERWHYIDVALQAKKALGS